MATAKQIPEILGYHLDWPDGNAPYKVWWKDGIRQPHGWKPTDDDLIYWLTGPQDKNVAVEVRRQSKWGGTMIAVVTVERDNASRSYNAPTLRAALEQAVREVDGVDIG